MTLAHHPGMFPGIVWAPALPPWPSSHRTPTHERIAVRRPGGPPPLRTHSALGQQERRPPHRRRRPPLRGAGLPGKRPAHQGRRDPRRAAQVGRRQRRLDGAQLATHPREVAERQGPRPGALQAHSRLHPPRRPAPRPLRRAGAPAPGWRRHRPAPRGYPLPRPPAARRGVHLRRRLHPQGEEAQGRRRLPRRAERDGHGECPHRRRRGRRYDRPPQCRRRAARAGFGALSRRHGREHRGDRHQHHHHPWRPAPARLHPRDRTRSHRGRLVHRTGRGHAVGDHDREGGRRAPAVHPARLRAACARSGPAGAGDARLGRDRDPDARSASLAPA